MFAEGPQIETRRVGRLKFRSSVIDIILAECTSGQKGNTGDEADYKI